MRETTITGLGVALGSGLAIGIQSTLFTLIGRSIGPFRASIVLNVIGGIVAGAILLGALEIQGGKQWTVPHATLGFATFAIVLGIFIVTGVAFAFQQTGVAAGIAALFMGQMLIGTIVDALGLAGSQAVPLDLRRGLGLVIMAVAILFLVQKR